MLTQLTEHVPAEPAGERNHEALEQENPQDVEAAQTYRAHHGDVALLLQHHHDLDGENAKSADEEQRADHEADDGILHLERGEKVGVRLLPALRVVLEEPLHAAREARREVWILESH